MSTFVNDSENLLDNLEDYSPWMKLDSFDWGLLASDVYLRKVPANTVIYHQQEYRDYVYIVKKGRVRLSIYSENGDEKCLTIAEEGSVFGDISVLDKLPNFATSITLVDCEIYFIPKPQFEKAFMENPEIAYNLIRSLVRKIRILSSQIEDLSFKDACSRVASSLIKLSREHGSYSSMGHKLTIKFTHQEMASLTGLCRVTVSNIMSKLLNDGIIYKDGGYIVIKDLNRLYEWI